MLHFASNVEARVLFRLYPFSIPLSAMEMKHKSELWHHRFHTHIIQLIKETSILGYVGIVDLTKAASYVSSRTYQMFIPLLAAGIVYYLIVKVLSILLGKFERRLKESD